MVAFLKKIYRKLFPNYENELNWAIGNSKSVLDVGCGFPSPIQKFSSRFYSVGTDIFLPSIEKSRAARIHSDYVQADVMDIDKHFPPNSFECVLASDLIEHLPKEQGDNFLKKVEDIAEKRIIIFTPNGFLPQQSYDNNPWQEHKSGWSVEDMEKRGYEVIGINGWKPLRGEFVKLKYRPRFFWQIVSDFTQLYTRKNPKAAFQILCIKNK